MSLTKASFSMISGAVVNVLDYIPPAEHAAILAGTSTYDAGPNIQTAINYALTLCKKTIYGVTSLVSKATVMTVLFPCGVYNTAQTLTVMNSTQVLVRLRSDARATIRYTGSSNCLTIVGDPAQDTLVCPVEVWDIMFWKDNKTYSSRAVVIVRVSNCTFKRVSVRGFELAIANLGGIQNVFDFENQSIEGCDYAFLIQQDSGFTGATYPIKPNLVRITGAYFVTNAKTSILIQRNPEESLVNNGSGGLISIEDCNFQGGGTEDGAISIAYPGESPGNGTVTINRCWFEAHGKHAVKLTAGHAVLNSCVFAGLVLNEKPFLLMDNTSTIEVNNMEANFLQLPFNSAMVHRNDATVDDIGYQISGANNFIYGEPGLVYLGPRNPTDITSGATTKQVVTGTNIADNFTSLSGMTATLAVGASELAFAINVDLLQRSYLIVVKENNGNMAWRGLFFVTGNAGGTTFIFPISQSRVDVTATGNNVFVKNTDATLSVALSWNAICIGAF